MHAAIDLGGTKIEAALFDENLVPIKSHRIPTPNENCNDLLTAIDDQINWLKTQANDPDLTIGMGVPGLVNKSTDMVLTSNLPTQGKAFRKDISKMAGQTIPIENDCRCFTLSEINGGAGAEHKKVFGLIVGTGIAGGVCVDGKLSQGLNNLSVEVGHIALPSTLIMKYEVPLLQCGCGRTGCYETLVSGPGLNKLAKHLTGKNLSTQKIALAANSGNKDMQNVMTIWLEFYCHLLDMIQLMLDPDCIVLGGGTSLINALLPKLTNGVVELALENTQQPKLLIAKFGDSPGVRGAAMLAIKNQMEF